MKRRGLVTLGITTLSVLALVAGLSLVASEARLDFQLKDQFGRPHGASELLGEVVVLVVSDRRGQDAAERWVPALREALGVRAGETRILRALDLRGVPFFMKAKIRKGLSQRPDEWSLLDWEGHFARAWPLEPGVANLLVFDGEGRLVGQVAGRESGAAPEAESLTMLVAHVEAARGS